MKKAMFIGLGIGVLIVATHWVDKNFRRGDKRAVSVSESGEAASIQNIALKDLQDGDVTLARYKGQVVLVNFWATWCQPCQVEIPWLIEFQEKYGPRGFTVLGVSMDEDGRKEVVPFMERSRFDVNGKKEAINYPVLLGNDAVAEKFGGLIGIPTSILVSRDGKKIKTIVGLIDHDEIAKDIEARL